MLKNERVRQTVFLLLIILSTLAVLNMAFDWVRWGKLADEAGLLVFFVGLWGLGGYALLRWFEKHRLRPKLALPFLMAAGAASTIGFFTNQGWVVALVNLATWLPAIYLNLYLARERTFRRIRPHVEAP